MGKLFKYCGTVDSYSVDGKGCGKIDLILSDISDRDKAPIRLTACGALAKYIYDIGCTDAEERYIKSEWYYDSCLYLRRIEVPSSDEHTPAKVITQIDILSEEIAVFGLQEYIETDSPAPMDKEQAGAYAWWKYSNNY